MRIPLFFYDALKDKEHIALLSKENPNITFQKTHSLGYKIIFEYHSFREKYLHKYNQTPSLLAIKWFNFLFYIKNIFIKQFLNISIYLFIFSIGIGAILILYYIIARLFGLL